MSNIIIFPLEKTRLADEGDYRFGEASIIIFPGVRVEHRNDDFTDTCTTNAALVKSGIKE